MATYIVKTFQDRNLLISADRFELNPHASVYVFLDKDGKQLASVPKKGVFAVVEDTAFSGDLYIHTHEGDEAEELLDRATDLLMGENVNEDEFWDDYFAFVGVPEVTEPEEVAVG